MRAFIAVGLPDEVRDALAGLQRQLDASRADVKWVEPANLHLTLKFLADLTEAQRAGMDALLRQIADRQPKFVMRLGALGAFPTLTAPRVVWVGCEEGQEPLIRMAQQVEAGAAALNLPREERPFAAHLTIGRVRSPRGRADLVRAIRTVSWTPPAAWPVTALTLYQSVLSSRGPTYTALAEVALA